MQIKDGDATFEVRSLVKTVNNKHADDSGNINLGKLVQKINGISPDANGNINISANAIGAIGTVSRSNNFVKFTNGLQMCWGSDCAPGWITFPSAFSTGCACVVVSMQSTGTNEVAAVGAYGWNRYGFNLRANECWHTQRNGSNFSTDGSTRASYVAFGF